MDSFSRNARMDVKDEDLPVQFQNVIVENTDAIIVIRSNLKSVTDINSWVSEFGRKTNTNWNSRDSCPSGERFVCWKKFLCHHSSFRKVSRALNKKTKLSKNSNCPASLKIRVKVNTSSSRRNDNFLKQGLPAVVTITPFHNHTINTEEALRFLPAVDCREKFLEYFNDGMGIAESAKYHKEVLQMQDNFEEADLANSRINPTARTIRHWYDKWRLPRTGPKMIAEEVSMPPQFIQKSLKAIKQEDIKQEPDTDCPSDNNDLFEKIIKIQKDLYSRFGSSSSGLKFFYLKLNKISSEGQWEEFLHTAGNPSA